MTETELFALIRKRISTILSQKQRPVRVAINGIEGTGKTVFTRKLTTNLQTQKIKALHVSIDGFHFDKKIRYRQGKDSAKGYYEDAYDESGFVEKLLLTSQSDHPTITKATHDLDTDKYLHSAPIPIDKHTVILTDGAYLFKSTFREHWDLKIYLKTSFAMALQRGVERDRETLGGHQLAKKKFEERYHAASRRYLQENQPLDLADLVIDNSDCSDLKLLKNRWS